MSTLDDELKYECKTIIMELMMVLYKHGITEVHMGGILRLMGVDEEVAQESDEERIVLDEKFTTYIKRMLEISSVDLNNKTLH